MRYAELLFLALLVAYHLALLLPRHRRPFPANYLVFLAGMALVWSLAMEGLRWQTILPLSLLLIDLSILFPTFATLQGRVPRRGFLPALGTSFRYLVATLALLVALASGVLAVAFPLPSVELTGGNAPSQRVVRFPPTGEDEGLELRLWYPAVGDTRPQPRAMAEPQAWQAARLDAGLPVFWQSYLEHLPSANILGGRLAAPKTKYPVIYVVTSQGQPALEFSYLFEDLASRGFVVVAGSALPQPVPSPPVFEWDSAWMEVTGALVNPEPWLQPEATREKGSPVPDGRWLESTQQALEQLANEPGDLFYEAIDWERQGLWVGGADPGLGAASLRAMGIHSVIRAGAVPTAGEDSVGLELWLSPAPAPPSSGPSGRWILSAPGLRKADLTDAAYLKPYLAFFGLKSQADAGHHGAFRQYQAAFFHYAFWNPGDGGPTFGQTVPQVGGLSLTGR